MRRVRWRMRSVAAGFGVLVILLLAGGVAAANSGSTPSSTSSGAQQPLPIHSASLTQDGQDFVWRIQLGEPFSPGALAREQRSLCLLFERVASGSVRGELCVSGPARHSSGPTVVYMNGSGSGSGSGQVIAATVTRTSSSDLEASFLPAAVDLSYGPIRWQVISTLRGAACAPPTPSGGCSVLYPAQPTLLKPHTPALVGCVPSGPSLVFHGPSREREIALTFDDGPWSEPPSIDFVNLLARYHVPATFFEIGEEIPLWDKSGAVERKMLADGDMIGDHTWNHPDMVPLSPAEQTSELERASAAIRHATGLTTCLWRPPYGDISPQLDSLARNLGFLTIYWNVDTVDWSLPGTSTIYDRAVSGARNGAIIEMHFGGGPRYETLDALPQMIDTLRARGYKFVNIAQMLGLRLIYR